MRSDERAETGSTSSACPPSRFGVFSARAGSNDGWQAMEEPAGRGKEEPLPTCDAGTQPPLEQREPALSIARRGAQRAKQPLVRRVYTIARRVVWERSQTHSEELAKRPVSSSVPVFKELATRKSGSVRA